MAISGDFRFLERLIDQKLLRGRVLELGSYNRQGGEYGNAKLTIERGGLSWEGADIEPGPGVDFTLDVLDPTQIDGIDRRWDAVFVMNLLEHVYDPIRALEGALCLVDAGGSLVVAGPTVWQLHDFPADFWRPMPDFFIEFAQRHECEIPTGGLQWIVVDRLIDVETMRRNGQKQLPSAHTAPEVWGRSRAVRSRLIHRVAHTTGRDMFFPYVGLGACLRRGQ